MNGFLFFTIFAKSSILDVWQDSEFASESSNNLQKKAPSQMLSRVLNSPLYYLRKTVAYFYSLVNLVNIFHQISSNKFCAGGQTQVASISTYLFNDEILIVFPNHVFLKTMKWGKRVKIQKNIEKLLKFSIKIKGDGGP